MTDDRQKQSFALLKKIETEILKKDKTAAYKAMAKYHEFLFPDKPVDIEKVRSITRVYAFEIFGISL